MGEGTVAESVSHLRVGVSSLAAPATCEVDIRGSSLAPMKAKVTYYNSRVRSINEIDSSLIAASLGVVAGQMCLAPRVEMTVTLPADTMRCLSELAAIIYASHSYAQRRSLVVPHVSTYAPCDSPQAKATAQQTALLLWSGGKDAIASLQLLRHNGFKVYGLHVEASFDAASLERKASLKLARRLDLDVTTARLDWDCVRDLGRRCSSSFDRYPVANSVPHGRDLVLAAIAVPLARALGVAYICAGYEYELWDKLVTWQGQSVQRHDIQSRQGGILLSELLTAQAGVAFFSPIAGLREIAILEAVLSVPELWPMIESCFWGNWCGGCMKCTRYALVEKVLGCDTIPFRNSPLELNAEGFRALLESFQREDIAYWEEQVYCLFELRARGAFDSNPELIKLIEQAEMWYEPLRHEVTARLGSCYINELAPQDFLSDADTLHSTLQETLNITTMKEQSYE